MVGLIIPFLAALPAAFAAGAPICDPGSSPSRCEAAPRAVAWLVGTAVTADLADEPRYATQAVIDCPAPVAGAPGLVGECDGTPSDASYRASRDPDSERVPSSLRPARRDRNAPAALAACAGLPSEGGDTFSSPAPSQPMALFALPALPPASASRIGIERSTSPPTRSARPLERPPRA